MYSCGKVGTEKETMAKLQSDALSDLSDLELSDSGTVDNIILIKIKTINHS
jgi:hypothetical protein